VKNESGAARTINVAGFSVVATDNPFFLDLGVNGRRCVTCHQPANNMSVSAADIRARFEATGGTDPNFYDVRFGLGLTNGQKADLVAFLRSL
jgi:cytochrome c peroxidase